MRKRKVLPISLPSNDFIIFDSGGFEFLSKILFEGQRPKCVNISKIDFRSVLDLFNPNITIFAFWYYFKGTFPDNYNWKRKILGSIDIAKVKKCSEKTVISYKGCLQSNYAVVANNISGKKFVGIAWAQIHERILDRIIPSAINYYVFGHFDKEALMRINIPEEQIHAYGALLSSYYKDKHNIDQPLKYDILIISQVINMWFEPGVGQKSARKLGKKIYTSLLVNLRKFLTEIEQQNLCIAVAMRPQGKMEGGKSFEKDFHEKYLSEFDVTYIESRPEEYSTYGAIASSYVVLNHYSTVAFEVLDWKKKVMFYQPFEHKIFVIPDDIEWKVMKDDYNQFRGKLIELMALSSEEYSLSIESIKKRYNNNDAREPSYKRIINEIGCEIKS
jgi:hypothetical protein